jgi:hypothetical protein
MKVPYFNSADDSGKPIIVLNGAQKRRIEDSRLKYHKRMNSQKSLR